MLKRMKQLVRGTPTAATGGSEQPAGGCRRRRLLNGFGGLNDIERGGPATSAALSAGRVFPKIVSVSRNTRRTASGKRRHVFGVRAVQRPPKGVSSLDLPDGLLSHRVFFPRMRRSDPA